MIKRKLGSSDIEVSPLCFGTNVFGWTIDEAQSFKLLDALTDAGIDFIDTADVYSTWAHGGEGGQSETIIGNWIKSTGKRDKLVIATKVGKEMGPHAKGLLHTDYIDLYQSHDDDPNIPFEETLGAYGDLIKQGKVRAIGASNYSAQGLKQALEVSKANGLPAYQTLQPLYNLYDREVYEKELEPLCLEKGIGVINYYALASGFFDREIPNRSRSGEIKTGKQQKVF
jgi:aryl-alcohol dehydrogenase-like predicted oxidoreductase